ncbi:MAG TPA: DUF4344 domain-containing metallopeptidase [Bauldia sp.]|nr:DUF4344 domain-containing metallopeptidase [Bauldia sp.]
MKSRTLAAGCAALLALAASAAVGADDDADNRARAAEFALNHSTMVLYHEIGHLFVGEFGLPVLGKGEDAADSLATVFLLEEGDEWADQVLRDAADGWYMTPFNGNAEPGDWNFMDEHSLDKQRSFAIVCMMVGQSPDYYAEVADEYGLDADRKEKCKWTYKQASDSWHALLDPHLLNGREQTGHVTVVYEDPGDFADIEAELRNDQFLEHAAEIVEDNYLLPRDLTFRARQCGQANAFYQPGDAAVTFCYEYTRHLAELWLTAGEDEDAAADDGAGGDGSQ